MQTSVVAPSPWLSFKLMRWEPRATFQKLLHLCESHVNVSDKGQNECWHWNNCCQAARLRWLELSLMFQELLLLFALDPSTQAAWAVHGSRGSGMRREQRACSPSLRKDPKWLWGRSRLEQSLKKRLFNLNVCCHENNCWQVDCQTSIQKLWWQAVAP